MSDHILKNLKRHPDDPLTVGYLLEQHPHLDRAEAESLLLFSRRHTICMVGCYGDGSIIYPLWRDEQLKD